MRFEREVLEIALEALRDRSEVNRPPIRRPVRRRWRSGIAISAAGVAIAIALPIVLPGGGTGGADPAAAGLLHRAALRAAARPAEPLPGDGEYLYSKSTGSSRFVYVVGDGDTFVFHATGTRESWIGSDGSGRIIETPESITFPTDRDRAAWIAAGSPSLEWVVEGDPEFEHLEPGSLVPNDFTGLPTDPEELRELIERRELIGGPPGDYETFVIVGDLLRETWTTPQVRAALYQVAAELPGVELVGRVVDDAGRAGVAVAYAQPGGDARSRLELIFDPTTAELLGERQVMVEDSTVDVQSGGPGAVYGGVGPAGTETYSATYLVSGVVENTTERL
jgi:hypothetical protein